MSIKSNDYQVGLDTGSPTTNNFTLRAPADGKIHVSKGNLGSTTDVATIDASGNMTLSGNMIASSSMMFRNKIINGKMEIDQRNVGASVAWSTSNLFPVDRWKAYAATGSGHTAQRVADAPLGSGFIYSTKMTVGTGGTPAASDLNIFYQAIEGNNISELMFGSTYAKSVTISFWVKSSITGTFGTSLQNSGVSRGCSGQYTINATNTWEQKSVTITGDLIGTWLTDTGLGMYLTFDLGSGTNADGTLNVWGAANIKRATGHTKLIQTSGATWNVTGVQLEVGNTASVFEHRPYGTELALCQRYYYRVYGDGTNPTIFPTVSSSATVASASIPFPVTMRSRSSALDQSGTVGHYDVSGIACTVVPAWGASTSVYNATVSFTVASGLGNGFAAFGRIISTSGYLGFSSEF